MSIMFAVLFSLSSCGKWVVPPEYIGKWETDQQKITVRTKAKFEPFRFTSDSAKVVININVDNTVSGQIGSAEFTNVALEKNHGLTWSKVVSPLFIIKCGSIGKIFECDPLKRKEVEIWFAPINSEGSSNSELRYTEGGAQFPMAHLHFKKVKE